MFFERIPGSINQTGVEMLPKLDPYECHSASGIAVSHFYSLCAHAWVQSFQRRTHILSSNSFPQSFLGSFCAYATFINEAPCEVEGNL